MKQPKIIPKIQSNDFRLLLSLILDASNFGYGVNRMPNASVVPCCEPGLMLP